MRVGPGEVACVARAGWTERTAMTDSDKLCTDGEAYERLMGCWSRLVAETFLDWVDAPKNVRWLDVGCGNGAFTEELIARYAFGAATVPRRRGPSVHFDYCQEDDITTARSAQSRQSWRRETGAA